MKRERGMKKKEILNAVIFLAVTVLCLTACGKEKPEKGVQTPGTIADNVYLSGDGAFTVRAEERLWNTDVEKNGGESALYLKDEENVWISFDRAEGITKQMTASFEDSFVNGYMEGIKEYYPDAREQDSLQLNGNLARLDMTMTSDTGDYEMYQILYLASDGANGYIITSTIRKEEAERIKPLIYQVVESIEFVN